MGLHRGGEAGGRGGAVGQNTRGTGGGIESHQRNQRRGSDHGRRGQVTSPAGEREDEAMEALRMPSGVPSRNPDLPRNAPARRATRQLDGMCMTISKWSR